MLLVLLSACTPPDDPGALAIDQIVPASGSSEVDVAIRIEGSNFTRPIRSSVDDGETRITDFSLTLDGVPLEQPAWRNEDLFEAMVPAGRAPGTYDVGVQVGGRTVVVPGGYTVLGPNNVGNRYIYIATEQHELWRIDPVAMETVRIGAIYDLDGTTTLYMHALAVDVDGTLVGITASPRLLVRIDPATARVTTSATVTVEHAYWGATVAPAGTFAPQATLLVAANDDGKLYQVASDGVLTEIGNFGGDLRVAGDIAFLPGDGLFATVYAAACSGTCVARVASSGQASLLATTGPGDLWGLSAFDGVLYAFGGNSDVYIVNRTTGELVPTFSTSVPGMSDAAP
jgi:hypothetical protein